MASHLSHRPKPPLSRCVHLPLLVAVAAVVGGGHLTAQSPVVDVQEVPAEAPDPEPRGWIVALRPSQASPRPFDVRTQGLAPEAVAVIHAQELAERVALYEQDIAGVLAAAPGVQVLEHLPHVRVCVLDATPDVIDSLSALPVVASVVRNGRCRAQLTVVPSDQNAIRAEHHGADQAHAAGFTGLGGTVQPVLGILDSWLDGWFGSTLRDHAVLHEGGLVANPSRVLAHFDATGVHPVPPTFGPRGRHHGLGMAAFAAGHATDLPAVHPFAHGQAPNAALVGVNITRLYAETTFTCNGQPGWKDPAGFYASVADIVAGLNRLAASKFVAGANRPIQVANLSYGGPTNPDHALNLRIDDLVLSDGILVVTSAGNYDPAPAGGAMNVYESFYLCNGLCIGASGFMPGGGERHPVEPFSGVGPLVRASTAVPCWIGAMAINDPHWRLPSDAYAREFPDLAAAGAQMVVPRQGGEALIGAESGTSISAAVVSGAAMLFLAGPDGTNSSLRSVIEAKAALLATAENESVSGLGDNRRGAGFLRTDRMVSAPSYASALQTATATIGNTVGATSSIGTFATRPGTRYAVAITWLRTNLNPGLTNGQPNWADLDLVVVDGAGNVLTAASRVSSTATSGNRTWERLEFTSPGGNLDVRVVVNRIAPQATVIDVGLAVAELAPSVVAPAASVTISSSLSAAPCGVPTATAGAPLATSWPAGVPFAPDVSMLREVAIPFLSELSLDISPARNVVRVELRGRFARDLVVPCRLLGGRFVQHPSGPGQGIFPLVVEPDDANVRDRSLLRVNAATGIATAEFATAWGGRFLAFEVTPEMSVFQVRVGSSSPNIAPVHQRQVGTTLWTGFRQSVTTSQTTIPRWDEGSLYFDQVVTPGVLLPGQVLTTGPALPSLSVRGAPIAGRSYDLVVTNADPHRATATRIALVAADFASNEVPLFAPGCLSILKPGGPTSALTIFPPDGESVAMSFAVPAVPSLLGLVYHQQGIVMSANNGVSSIAPTRQIVTVRTGL